MIISVALQKGGVGKTTTVVNTATVLAENDRKVLVIDFDSQANATMSFGFEPDVLDYTIADIIEGYSADLVIQKTEYNVDLIPANTILSGLFITVITDPKKYPSPMTLLKDKLADIKRNYDYIFIDLPPELGFYTVNGLTASDYVLIPMQCEARATRGVNILLDSLEKVRAVYNPDIKVMGILGTMFNRNTNLSTTVLQQARRFFENKIKVYDTAIYRTIKFSEADLANRPAITYSDNEQIQNYRNFVREAFNIG